MALPGYFYGYFLRIFYTMTRLFWGFFEVTFQGKKTQKTDLTSELKSTFKAIFCVKRFLGSPIWQKRPFLTTAFPHDAFSAPLAHPETDLLGREADEVCARADEVCAHATPCCASATTPFLLCSYVRKALSNAL